LAVLIPPVALTIFEFIRHMFPFVSLIPMRISSLLQAAGWLLWISWFSIIIVRQVKLAQENDRRRHEAETLFEVGAEIVASLDSEHLLQSVVDHTRLLLKADVASLGLVDPESPRPKIVAASGITIPEVEQLRRRSGDHFLLEPVIQSGKPMLEEYEPSAGCDISCRMAVPLMVGNKPVGSLCVGTVQARRFYNDELALLEQFAMHASIVIEKARLQAQAEQVAVLQERERISRELHDGLAQILSYLSLRLEQLADECATHSASVDATELHRLHKVAHEASIDIRESILGLRITHAPGANIATTIGDYLAQYRDLNNIATELLVEDNAIIPITPMAEVQLMGIVQESLANVRKHANATQVRVSLVKNERFLHITIEDNGRGFSDEHTRTGPGSVHFGYMMMRERAELLEGNLTVDSEPGRGTQVSVQIPLSDKRSLP
jgi:signal transduction histidine kinase